jgi:hypothetical protein
MLNARPEAMLWLGNGPGEDGCFLHDARYEPCDTALPIGASFLERLAERFLEDRGRLSPPAVGVILHPIRHRSPIFQRISRLCPRLGSVA